VHTISFVSAMDKCIDFAWLRSSVVKKTWQ